MKDNRRNLIVYSAACAAMFAFANAHAQANANTNEWQYSLTPYLWLPVIDGALNYGPPPGGGGNPNVEVGPTDWLDLLNFAVLVSGSARKDDFVMFSDFVYFQVPEIVSEISFTLTF